VPPKVKDLVAELEGAGFVNRGGKGSHRNFVHPSLARPVTKLTDDGKHYQIRAVRLAIKELKR
jgi:predicted RNA binding protein YcfA (HicA-like mRNA interferase family)